MSITAAELELNLGKYLALAEYEDIYITLNGKTIAKLTSATSDRRKMADSLLGIIPADTTLEEAHKERAQKL